MNLAFQLAPGALYQGEKPVRNDRYRRFIKRFPFFACGGTRWIDPMHTGSHALGQKASDINCLPGCRACPEQFDANPKGVAERHELDIPLLIQSFNRLWDLKQRSQP